jgi:hypothetical protein
LDGYFCSLATDLPLNLVTSNFQHHLDSGGFADGSGDFIVALQSLTAPESTYLRHFDANGNAAGAEYQLDTGNYLYAAVAGFADGRYVSVHEPSTLTSRAANDAELSQADIGTLGGTNGRFSVAVLGATTFVAAGTANWRIFSIDDAGVISTASEEFATPAGGVPQLFAFSDGRFVLRLNGDTVQRYSVAGAAVGGLQGSGLGQYFTSGGDIIVDDGASEDVFAVTYIGATGEVMVRAYNWAGTQGTPVDVGNATLAEAAEDLNAADVVGLPDGGALAIYQQYVNYDDRRIIGQRLDLDGLTVSVPEDEPLRIDRDGVANRYVIKATRISENRTLVTWIYRTPSVFYHARGQILHYVQYP